jgi:hypothetical protein
MAKRYWHTLADSTIKELVARHTTWRQAMERYKQPDWCSYPNALEGVMGCWSLTDPRIRHEISNEYCAKCDCFRKEEQ